MRRLLSKEQVEEARREWKEYGNAWVSAIDFQATDSKSLAEITNQLLFCELCDVVEDATGKLTSDALLERIAAHPNTPSNILAELVYRFPDAFCRNPSAAAACADAVFLARLNDFELRRLLRYPDLPRAVPEYAREKWKIAVVDPVAQEFVNPFTRNTTDGWISRADNDMPPEKRAQDLMEDARLHVAVCDAPPVDSILRELKEKLRSWADTAHGSERHLNIEWVEFGLAPRWVGGNTPYPEPIADIRMPIPRFLMLSGEQKLLLEEAAHPETAPGRLIEIARSGKNAVLLAIAQNPRSPTAALAEIMSDKGMVRQMHDILSGGLSYPFPIHYAVAIHPHAEWDALEKVLLSRFSVARRVARRHPYFVTHPEQREKMHEASPQYLLKSAWRGEPSPICLFLSRLHPEMPVADWSRAMESDRWLISEPDSWLVLLAAALHPHIATASAETQQRFLNDGNQWVRTVAHWRIAHPNVVISF